MLPVATVGSIAVGLCPCPPSGLCPATGVVSVGMPIDILNTPITTMGGIVSFPCGPFVITTGMPTYLISGMPAAMLGSSCVGAGTGTITAGNPTFIV